MSYDNIVINYAELVRNYFKVIKYAGKFSDSFSVITNLKKPYSKIPPNYEHEEVLKELEPYMINQIVGLKEWPGTILGSVDCHRVMNVYQVCRESREIILKMPNFFLPKQSNLPEDICFYRNKKVWLATVSHEKIAFMENLRKEDIDFLNEIKISFYM